MKMDISNTISMYDYSEAIDRAETALAGEVERLTAEANSLTDQMTELQAAVTELEDDNAALRDQLAALRGHLVCEYCGGAVDGDESWGSHTDLDRKKRHTYHTRCEGEEIGAEEARALWRLAIDPDLPRDAWPRPCVVDSARGYHVMELRYENGVWLAPGQFREQPVRNVRYWMEVYPLPDGTYPPAWDIQPTPPPARAPGEGGGGF